MSAKKEDTKGNVGPSEPAGNDHQIQNLLLIATQKALERTSAGL